MEIIKAIYLDGYRLKVFFNNGESRIMDFSITDTIEWDCGRIDIAPEYLWEHASAVQ